MNYQLNLVSCEMLMILASFTTIHMVYSVWLVAVGTCMPSDYVVECASELCVGPGVVSQTWASSPATCYLTHPTELSTHTRGKEDITVQWMDYQEVNRESICQLS